MIGWLAWFFLALPLFMLDGWLAERVLPVPAMTFAVCLFLGSFARPSALPGLLVCAALARSVTVGGDVAVQALILGLPVAALLPFRGVFYPRSLAWQAVAGGFLALGVPKITALLGRFSEAVPTAEPVEWGQLLVAALAVPAATWLLRQVPPLRWFGEARE